MPTKKRPIGPVLAFFGLSVLTGAKAMADEKPADPVSETNLQTPECKESLRILARDTAEHTDLSQLFTPANAPENSSLRKAAQIRHAMLGNAIQKEEEKVQQTCGATSQNIALHNARLSDKAPKL